MGQALEIQDFELAVVDLHDSGDRGLPASALDGKENLLLRLMHNHVINDDLIGGCPEQRRQLSVDSAD